MKTRAEPRKKVVTVRCSSLPMLFLCPSTHATWEVAIQTTGEEANLGTAVHYALAEMIRHGPHNHETLAAIAKQYQVDEDELSRLYHYGEQAWQEISKHFGDVKAEIAYHTKCDGFDLTGSPDIVGGDHTGDFKSGYKESTAALWQIRGQCRLTASTGGWLVWLRSHTLEYVEALPPAEFDRMVREQLAKVGKVYSPGTHCEYCGGREICTARRLEIRTAIDTLAVMSKAPGGGALTTLEKALCVYPHLGAIVRMCEAIRGMVREAASAGPLPLPSGEMIVLDHYNEEKIDPMAAWPMLEAALKGDQTALARCMTVGKGALADEVGKIAEKGRKQKDVEELMGRLRAANAVIKIPRTKLQVRAKEA